ncbi:hypothetical protein BB559_003328 [Furculomyces boomerangus]|uniref:Uncharacterized protein n=1 Tax=Furculomyces boomerangus TaxID=61424 RepID=A0A2T9YLX1_9FUNG|nr:hypothetical protein BB559_005041 [Furculomyces boomerangus]PVU93330.1 hypothetical protein BB559_003328 [Furculomyces boomerangus]
MIQDVSHFDLLSYQTIADIFVYSQNPNLATISKSFYNVSSSTNIQVRYFLYGSRKFNTDLIQEFFHKYSKLAKKEEFSIGLIGKMDLTLGNHQSIISRTIENGWINCMKKIVACSKLVPIIDFSNGQNDQSNKKPKIERYDIVSTINLEQILPNFYIKIAERKSVDLFNYLLDAHNLEIDSLEVYGIPGHQMVGGSNIVKLYKKPLIQNIPIYMPMKCARERNIPFLKYSLNKKTSNENLIKDMVRGGLYSKSIEVLDIVLDKFPLDTIEKSEVLWGMKHCEDLEFTKYVLNLIYKREFNEKELYKVVKPDIERFSRHADLNHIDFIKFCIKNGTSIEKNLKAVECAIRCFCFETTEYFLSMVSVDKLSLDALVAGMKSKNPQFIKLLIDNQVDVDIKDGTPLYHACHKGFTESTKCLIENGANIYLDNSKALQKAVKNNYLDIVELILKNSNKPHDFIEKSSSKICISGNFSLANLFIKYKQVPKSSLDNTLLKTLDKGFNILVELLLENGADYNVDRGKLLELAIKKKEKRIVDILLSKNDIIINTKSIKQFLYGCRHNKFVLIQKFISPKSKVFLKNGSEGFLIALENGYEEISKVLIENINDLDSVCNKALVFACKHGYLDIVKKLCSNNKINVNVDEGDAYFYSVMNGYSEIPAVLIRAGLDKKHIEMGEIVEACREGNIEKVREMVGSKNIDISFQQDVCLKTVCKSGNMEMLRSILGLKRKP